MSRNSSSGGRRGTQLLLLALLGLLANAHIAEAALYQAGQIVSNFTLYARLPFTNMAGRVFSPLSPVRLTDLAGYVVFAEFFDPT